MRYAGLVVSALVEVSSPGAEEHDRSDELERYRKIPVLRQHVIISHRERRISIWSRTNDDT